MPKSKSKTKGAGKQVKAKFLEKEDEAAKVKAMESQDSSTVAVKTSTVVVTSSAVAQETEAVASGSKGWKETVKDKVKDVDGEVPELPMSISTMKMLRMTARTYQKALKVIRKRYGSKYAVSYTHLTLPTIYSV